METFEINVQTKFGEEQANVNHNQSVIYKQLLRTQQFLQYRVGSLEISVTVEWLKGSTRRRRIQFQ